MPAQTQVLLNFLHFPAGLQGEIMRLAGILQDLLHRSVALDGFAVSKLLVGNGHQASRDFSVKPALQSWFRVFGLSLKLINSFLLSTRCEREQKHDNDRKKF